MLSRIAARALVNVTSKPSILYRSLATSPATQSSSPAPTEHRRYPHDAPERDFVNFPPFKVPEEGGKVRIGFIPEEWFKAVEAKSGVMGPYVLFWGGLATIFSKEYYVVWADTWEHITFFALLVYATKKFGPQIAAYLDKSANEANQAYETELKDKTQEVDSKIVSTQALQSLPEANQLVNAAKRENVLLQLEETYRQRLSQVHQEVKKRLDYQVAVQNAHRRVEREEALNYIIGEVHRSIGPNQEKEAFQSGLAQLKVLSQKYAGTV